MLNNNLNEADALLRPFVGSWQNTASHTLWIKRFDIVENDRGFYFRPYGFDQSEQTLGLWGEHIIDSFLFHSGETAFRSCFDYQDIKVDMTAYSNKGILVTAMHLEFNQKPDNNHLSREFFARIAATPIDRRQGSNVNE